MTEIIKWLESFKWPVFDSSREKAEELFYKFVKNRPEGVSIDLASCLVGSVLECTSLYCDIWIMQMIKIRKEEEVA